MNRTLSEYNEIINAAYESYASMSKEELVELAVRLTGHVMHLESTAETYHRRYYTARKLIALLRNQQ